MLRSLILLLFPLHLFAFSDIGVITIWFDNDGKDAIKIYDSQTAVTPHLVCHSPLPLDSLLPSYTLYYDTTEDASTISYCCVAETKDRYCIRQASQLKPFYWIEKTLGIQFRTWKEWWLGSQFLTIRSSDTLHIAPNAHSDVVKMSCNCQVAVIDSVAGEWLEISTFVYCCEEGKSSCVNGNPSKPIWIMWRKGEAILPFPQATKWWLKLKMLVPTDEKTKSLEISCCWGWFL